MFVFEGLFAFLPTDIAKKQPTLQSSAGNNRMKVIMNNNSDHHGLACYLTSKLSVS